MRDGFLIVLSGPSGVGKGTVCESLLEKNKNIEYSISATTRGKRPMEIDGQNYHFLSKDEFEKMIKENKFLEYAQVHGNFYGTPKDFVYERVKQGKIVILEIDVQGALQVKDNYDEAVFIFLLPPDMEELRKRIEKRATEDKETIEIRMKNAENELSYIDKYDYTIVNDVVDNTVNTIENIIVAEKHRVMK